MRLISNGVAVSMLLGSLCAVRLSTAQSPPGPTCEARLATAQQYAQSLLVSTMDREAQMTDVRMKLLQLLGKPLTDQTPLAQVLDDLQKKLTPAEKPDVPKN